MTEAEWLACVDPVPMLEHLAVLRTDRRLCLYLVACGRAAFPLMPMPESQQAVVVTEAYLDGAATDDELRAAGHAAEGAYYHLGYNRDAQDVAEVVERVSRTPRQVLKRLAVWGQMTLPADRGLLLEQAALLAYYATTVHGYSPHPDRMFSCRRFLSPPLMRCVFGNPFRPVTADPSWLTSAVAGVAAAIYDARAFHDLPILADALQDAGCDDADVLGHLRGPGPHARGCWVVDLVLGRA